MGKRLFMGIITALLIPYIMTLAWTGTIEGKERLPDLVSGKRILMDGRTPATYMDVEEFMIGVVAKQIPADYGAEVLRAQAVIARTYIYKEMGDKDEIAESSLDMDYLEKKQMEDQWGNDKFIEYYENIEAAVQSTKGMVITSGEQLVEPLFHRASIGHTRGGDESFPYLQSVESGRDIEAEDYLSVMVFTKEDFVNRMNSIPESAPITVDQIPSTIQMIAWDDAGYVDQIQVGTKTYTGEEIQYALGLASPCFTLEEYEGKIRAVCKGIGHGYGFSQYGAKIKAEEEWKAEDILSYFYKNIVLISE